MTLLTIAIPVSLVVAAGAVLAFMWAARGDQWEDLDTPPRRMLLDDPPAPTMPRCPPVRQPRPPDAGGAGQTPST
jgi:cbb3-type cytochrome oxidase maturation protein